MKTESTADLGELVIVFLASTLVGLRDRLADDNFTRASNLVAELTDQCDTYLGDELMPPVFLESRPQLDASRGVTSQGHFPYIEVQPGRCQ